MQLNIYQEVTMQNQAVQSEINQKEGNILFAIIANWMGTVLSLIQ